MAVAGRACILTLTITAHAARSRRKTRKFGVSNSANLFATAIQTKCPTGIDTQPFNSVFSSFFGTFFLLCLANKEERKYNK